MNALLEPLQSVSLVDTFVERMEQLILSGELAPGTTLPSERVLASQLSVSRPVVHEGLVALAARGLVEIRPRVGTVVLDWRRDGSLALLATLFSHADTQLEPRLLLGLLDARRMVEEAAAGLAATLATEEDLAELREAHARGARATSALERMTADFALHHGVARASGNPIYAMLIKSCEPAFMRLGTAFYEVLQDPHEVVELQSVLLAALEAREPAAAAVAMAHLLAHGRRTLLQSLEPT